MKKIYQILCAVLLLTGAATNISCTDYQDEIDALDYRITVLENLVKKVNNNLEMMQVVVTAMENGDYITGVRETSDGYAVNFHKAGPIYIIDGVDGIDGKDAQAPDISIEKDPQDGMWYWVVNGEWLIVDGQKINATGKDGKDGKDGQDGKDGVDGKDGKDGADGKDAIAPQVRINPATGIWEISVDGGYTWITTGTSATGKDGADGKDGKDGQDGKDGKDGKDGEQFFANITYTIDAVGYEYMVITTKSGQVFRIPIYTSN